MTVRHDMVVRHYKRNRVMGNKAKCDVCGWRPPKGLKDVTSTAYKIMHAHHVVPVSCGGADHKSNLVLLCPNCHAIAHRLGTMSPAKNQWPEYKWRGPTTPLELLTELALLILTPELWERRAKDREKAAAETKRLAKAVVEQPEAETRRAAMKVLRASA